MIAPQPAPSGRRTAASEIRSLPDAQLVTRMRAGQPMAWGEFAARFRPALEAFARRAGIPGGDWGVCITEVLDDEALRLAAPEAALPAHLGAYLVRATYHRYLRLKRSRSCRARHYENASDEFDGEWVVGALCSEHAVRASAGTWADRLDPALEEGPHGTVGRLAHAIDTDLTEVERLLLGWVAQGVSHRQIAEWLGVGYDAVTKRIWRLCRRIRGSLPRHVERFDDGERREVERFFRRAGAPITPTTSRDESSARPTALEAPPVDGRAGRPEVARVAR
ncbi:MAG TPA: hypothetical protein VEA99_16735 [Gemmatimonadaceae bacterium]|nr:hypothetical protein [Gemmatimonadaceae bacterium]